MRPSGFGTFGSRLKALRQGKGITQTDLARLIARHQTAIGPYERDEYMPGRDVVERLAAILDTTPEYLCFGRSRDRRTIPFAGAVGALCSLNSGRHNSHKHFISLPDERLQAFEVADDGMNPVFRRGQQVLVARLPEPEPVRLLARHALVEVADGRVLLRRLVPSADPDRFDLAAYAAPTLRAVSVLSARAVVAVVEPDLLGGETGDQSAEPYTVDEKFS